MVNVKNAILNSIDLKKQILNNDFLLETVEKIVDVCIKSLQNGNTIWWCGNGGSAADAQHLAAELDYSYDVIYSRYLNGCGRDGDVIIGITTSGNSKNIINAFAAAKEKNITTVGLTGDTGGKLASLSELLLNVPSKDTPRIQESHIMLGHIICELIEARIFSDET